MASRCPIKSFLDDCRDLSAFLDDINEKAKHLDIELDVLNRQTFRGEEASPAAFQVLDEIKELTRQNNRELSEVRDENRNYDQLLRMTLEQVKSLHAETTEYEEQHMAKYGFSVPPPLDPSLFDIFKVEAPGAAVDLPPEVDDTAGAGGDHVDDQEKTTEKSTAKKLDSVRKPVSVVSEVDDLSIFDIGLSKDTLRMLTGVGKSVSKKPDLPSNNPSNVEATIPINNAADSSSLGANFSVAQDENGRMEPSSSLNVDHQEAEMETNNIAPIVKLCNNFAAHLDMSVGGSPVLNPRTTKPPTTNSSLAARATQQIEISPGLYTTRSLRSREPERKSGNTDEIVNSIIDRNINKSESTDEIVNGIINSSNINQCNTPKSKSAGGGQNPSSLTSDLPETPELQTVNLKALLRKAGEKKGGSTKVTDDNTQLSPRLQLVRENKDEGRVSDLPETPELETVSIKSFAKDKKDIVGEESPLLTPELESFNKKEAFDLELPMTPELETVNLRQLLQKNRIN